MNGKPVWGRPARTKDYDFSTAPDADESRLLLLSEAPEIIKAAIKAGIVKPPKPAQIKPALGRRSEYTNCVTCGVQFTRHTSIPQTRCFSCRLPAVTCSGCKKTFQPAQRKQICCSVKCRVDVVRAAAQSRKGLRVAVTCAACKRVFEQTPGNKRKNCSKECGILSMSKTNKAKHEN